MYPDDFTLRVIPIPDPDPEARPEFIDLQMIEEKEGEYVAFTANEYCQLHFQIINLPASSIWHTRFVISRPMRLRVESPNSFTFLWAAWRNKLDYTIGSFPENSIHTGHYNLYHLPAVRWELVFRKKGSYETFNVLFKEASVLEEWNNGQVFPALEHFLNKAALDLPAFLSPEHLPFGEDPRGRIQDLMSDPGDGINRREYYQLKVTDLFFFLLRDIARTSLAPPATLSRSDIRKLQATQRYILEHLQERLRLPELIRIAGMNKNKLETGFRQLSGMSVFAYIRDQRMQKARRALREGKLSLREVAGQAGYKHLSNFSKAFSRHFRYPPSQVHKR